MALFVFQLTLFSITFLFLGEAREIIFGFLILSLPLVAIGRHLSPRVYLRLSLFWAGLGLTCALHIWLYFLITGLRFNLYQAIERPADSIDSVVMFFGPPGAIAIFIEFLLAPLLFVSAGEWALGRRTIVLPKWAKILTLALCAPAIFYVSDLVRNRGQDNAKVEIHFEGAERDDLPLRDESLIILQLESVNGAILFPGLGQDAKPAVPLPGLEKLSKMGGVWIPHFWANSFGTHLGMSTILCGANGALTAKLVKPENGRPCLPERFRRAGFNTAFYYSYRDAQFYRMDEHVSRLGFKEFHYGPELMKKDDPYWTWGYEDCRFYDRAFAHMKETGLDRAKKSFLYFSVHMNHVKFENHLSVKHPFEPATNFEQKYLNSAFEQDYCVAKFLENVETLKRDDLHVMIVGDHGFPVDSKWGNYNDFLTSFYFLPANSRQNEFKKGPVADFLVSQDQIVNTTLELFGAPRVRSSFLWALEGEDAPKDYRKCILISEMGHDMAIAVGPDGQVTKKLRDNRFFGSFYKDRQPVSRRRLFTGKDLAEYKVDEECISRIGTPPEYILGF